MQGQNGQRLGQRERTKVIDMTSDVRKMKWSWAGHINRFKDGPQVSLLGDHTTRRQGRPAKLWTTWTNTRTQSGRGQNKTCVIYFSTDLPMWPSQNGRYTVYFPWVVIMMIRLQEQQNATRKNHLKITATSFMC